MTNHYVELASIDCSAKIEKKNGLSYLPWAWAVDKLMRCDPAANWEYLEPHRWGETWMVRCAVTAFGKTMVAQLPVMDARNRAIANPDAFAINTAMQRCLAKAIALHGLGLYIYGGEDVPLTAEGETVSEALLNRAEAAASGGLKAYEKFWKAITPAERQELRPKHEGLKKQAMESGAVNSEKVAA